MNRGSMADFSQGIKNLHFKGMQDWLVHFTDPREIFQVHPSFVVAEFSFYLAGLLTFCHSLRLGGRFKYLWLAIFLHGLAVENMSFWLPDVDNFWHAQSSIMLLGRRLPLHITFLYPSFIYTAAVTVSRLRLSKWAEPFAVGLTVVLIDMPFDIVCVKFLHWTWHDTDPNISDRHYNVPWTSYYFHATFSASLSFFFHFWRRVVTGSQANQWESSGTVKEVICNILTVLCGIPGGILMFIVLYHPLHDYYKISTENCVVALLAIFLLTVWAADRFPIVGSRPSRKNGYPFNEIALALIIQYILPVWMLLMGTPENEASTGLHEKIGPCTIHTTLNNVLGMTLKKRKYLCPSDYDESYMDFHCLPNGEIPENGVEWYTICGTPFTNKAEYIQVIAIINLIAYFVFRQLLFKSGSEIVCNRGKKSKTH